MTGKTFENFIWIEFKRINAWQKAFRIKIMFDQRNIKNKGILVN